MTIRVLQVLWSGHIGGSEKHVMDLVRGLPSNISCTVCFLTHEEELGAQLTNIGIPWFSLRMKHGLDVFALLRLKWKISASQFDIIHEHSGNKIAIYAYRWFAPKSKTIFTEHNGEPISQFSYLRLQGEIAKLKRFHRVLCVSEKVAKSWESVACIQKIFVVPNGVNLNLFDYKGRDVKEANAPLISVGRLIPSKRTDLLIRLLGSYLKTSNRTLWIVGDGPEKSRIEELVNRERLNSHVMLLGARSDLPQLYSQCVLFVTATQYESFGLAIAEAAAAGLPCVAAAIDNLDELVRNNETGFLIPEVNLFHEFANHVALLVDSPSLCKSMGMSAHQWVQEHYSSDKLMKTLNLHYDELLEMQ